MSQHFTITGGVANNIAVVCGPSERTSNLLCIVWVGGVAVVSKKSADGGGSADEIGVSLGSNPSADNNTYTIKLTEADVSLLPSSGSVYKLYDVTASPEVEIETGNIAVSSAESAPVGDAFQVTTLCLRKTFTAPGSFGKNVPAGSICSKVLIKSKNATDVADLSIGRADVGNDIIDDTLIAGNTIPQCIGIDITAAAITMQSWGWEPSEVSGDIAVTGTFGGAELEIWLFFEKIQ